MVGDTLVCTVGLPRSGKTTWARRQGLPIVSPDSIRLALHGKRFVAVAEPWVWAMARTMVRALFLVGHDTVILDATNTTRKRRDEWQTDEWQTRFSVVDATKEVCIERANREGDDEIIAVIHRMASQFEPLGEGELAWE
jgi:predicted kinase